MQWDDEGLRYLFQAGEVSCLGAVKEEVIDGEGSTTRESESETSNEDTQDDSQALQEEHSVSDEVHQETEGAVGEEGEENTESDNGDVTSSTGDTSEEEDMTREQLEALAKRVGINENVIAASANIVGVTPTEALLRSMVQQYGEQDELATMGQEYIKSLRKEAISWYVRARQSNPEESIDTKSFERLLDKCGNDAELIKDLMAEHKDRFESKLPKAVRRSSFPVNANERSGPDTKPDLEEKTQNRTDTLVGKLHSN
jgi:hypothetical protein